MKIGISFDLKTPGQLPAGVPDDLQEEFDGPHTIEAIAGVLRELGHQVVLLGDGREFLEKVLADPPDVVFNFAEGQGVSRSREARVPAVLEMLGIPFTGSDPLTMAVTLDKECAKQIVSAAGVVVPRGVLVVPSPAYGGGSLASAGSTKTPPAYAGGSLGLQFPVIVKPAWEGSSKGIRNKCLVKTPGELQDVIRSIGQDHRQPLLVEEFIQGDELTVGMLGSPRQPVKEFIYSLEVKRDYRKQVLYECPAPLPPATTSAVRNAALTAFQALGCRDVARIDFRVRDGVPYFLEVNPLPGLNPDDSDLVIMAGLVDWSYRKLIEAILNAALTRS
jgi:D-alanine-D-alanine ligase